MDFDLDGDIDSDISGLLSFKGLLHFCIGFSTYLSVVSFLNTKSLYVLYNFTTLNYVLAVLTGLFFAVCLFYLYKFVMKADHYNNEQMNYDGMSGKIIINVDSISFMVNVSTPLGIRTVEAVASDTNVPHNIGDYVTLKYNEETKTYIF